MITLFISLFLLSCIVALSTLYFLYKRKYGSLLSEKVYIDTDEAPGPTLYSNTLPLMGRPDYLIKEGDTILPVEVKTGKTPTEPYENHVMQLMAYCYLVEENYGRPKGGILKYPDQEFKLVFTDEAKKAVIDTVLEIQNSRETNQEYSCNHKTHN